ncbi:hypothetical protein [Ktedonobacter sp. SOSP1-85]|uniref:hypothetical protein n=1 Tax=Ktedonobacter sp. SOSP1-85 TaxID=2778367 RepID=UPI001915D377
MFISDHHPDEKSSLHLGGADITVKLSGRETNGAFSLIETILDPGRLSPFICTHQPMSM